MTCPHGFEYRCDQCRADDKRIERDWIKSCKAEYGVFAWTGTNDYKIGKALCTYKRKSAAEKQAEKLNADPEKIKLFPHGYVVRLVML